jgi:polyhydroxyalkanoate synthesis regulator phasin
METTKTVKITKTEVKEVTPVIEITYKGLTELLLNHRGATFARLNTRTVPSMRKTNNPFIDNVVKDSIVTVMIGMEYANAVNNKRVKESMDEVRDALMTALKMTTEQADTYLKGLEDYADNNRANFEPKPRKWGEHMTVVVDGKTLVSKTMVVHTNKQDETNHYVQTWILGNQKPIYRYADTLKELSENDVEVLKTFLTESNSNAEHQGVKQENEIIIRDYKVENIIAIRLNKTEYILK